MSKLFIPWFTRILFDLTAGREGGRIKLVALAVCLAYGTPPSVRHG